MGSQAEGKSILFTNLFLTSRTGSELHILELSRAFVRDGWEVTCYALEVGYPLLSEFERAGITVVSYGEEKKLSDHYTAFFAQHQIASSYIWCATHISFDKVIVSTLGPQSEHEKPPFFAHEADLIVCNSGETLRANSEGLEHVPWFVFPNSASPEYFSPRYVARSCCAAARPKHIVVISNHIAPELRDLSDQLSDTAEITYAGYETASVEVTPDYLSSFDLVVTIGRTVQLCFALGVPVYCYDVFGGPGYLSLEKVGHAAQYNLSGRPECRRLSTSQLAEEIVAGYPTALRHLEDLRAYALEHFSFSDNFDKLLDVVERIDGRYRSGASSCLAFASTYAKLACDLYRASYASEMGLAQVYFTQDGEGISEDHSCRFAYHYRNDIEISLPVVEGRVYTRFDPDIRPVVCHERTGEVVPVNRSARLDSRSGDIFITDDPQYSGDDITRLSFSCSPLREKDLIDAYQDAMHEIQRKDSQAE